MSDERIRVWPAREGLIVRDPVTHEPIEPGQEVTSSREILRAIRAGDLVTDDPATKQTGVEQRRDGDDRERG